MENLENKIIRDKINAIENLPRDYVPSLDSKFELLIIGVNPNPKKRDRKILFIPWIVAAGISMLLFIYITQTYTHKFIKIPVKVIATSLNKQNTIALNDTNEVKQMLISQSKKENHFTLTSQTKNIVYTEDSVKKDSLESGVINHVDTAIVSSIVKIEKNIPPKLKKHRFVEIDFDEGTKNESIESGNLSSRFKLEIKFNLNNNIVQSPNPRQLQIKKDF